MGSKYVHFQHCTQSKLREFRPDPCNIRLFGTIQDLYDHLHVGLNHSIGLDQTEARIWLHSPDDDCKSELDLKSYKGPSSSKAEREGKILIHVDFKNSHVWQNIDEYVAEEAAREEAQAMTVAKAKGKQKTKLTDQNINDMVNAEHQLMPPPPRRVKRKRTPPLLTASPPHSTRPHNTISSASTGSSLNRQSSLRQGLIASITTPPAHLNSLNVGGLSLVRIGSYDCDENSDEEGTVKLISLAIAGIDLSQDEVVEFRVVSTWLFNGLRIGRYLEGERFDFPHYDITLDRALEDANINTRSRLKKHLPGIARGLPVTVIEADGPEVVVMRQPHVEPKRVSELACKSSVSSHSSRILIRKYPQSWTLQQTITSPCHQKRIVST